MNALQVISKLLNRTQTENGDLAYKYSGSACLDFFSLCGGMRKNLSDLEKLFVKAYAENPVLAIKILFYMRNIRGGLGERNSFRVLLKELAQFYPEMAKQVVYAVPEYGRWDDLLVLFETPVKDEAIALIKNQLEKDKKAICASTSSVTDDSKDSANGTVAVSLLGKWLPSINTSSKESVSRAKILMSALGMKAVEYRKLCSALRKEIKVIEDNLRRKDYTFDYSKQPSQAMLRYRKAFLRNDEERYKSFLNKVVEQTEKLARGEEIPEEERVKLNTKTLYPYQLVAPFMNRWNVAPLTAEQELPLEASWKSLERGMFDSRTIVVRDGSGSMYGPGDFSPINVATSLALLFAEQLGGAYKNSFITFSANPELIQIPENCDTLKKKLNFIKKFDDISNTDIAKVYQLILDVSKSANVPKEEMIERILIISDMEFDAAVTISGNAANGLVKSLSGAFLDRSYCCSSVESTFEHYKKKFEEAGYELPEIVFWNVAARSTHLPVTQNEKGVKLVSGASANIFENVISGDLKVMTPYDFMLQMLEPYSEVEKLRLAC